MYYHHEAQIAYLAPPRTATRATSAALKRVGFDTVGKHHDIDEAAVSEASQVLVTIRNHFDVITSWWANEAPGLQHVPFDPYDFGAWFRHWFLAGKAGCWAYIENGSGRGMPPSQACYLFHPWAKYATDLIRVENLLGDLNAALPNSLQIESLDRIGGQKRKGRRYQDVIGAAERVRIEQLFSFEMRETGYRWEVP